MENTSSHLLFSIFFTKILDMLAGVFYKIRLPLADQGPVFHYMGLTAVIHVAP